VTGIGFVERPPKYTRWDDPLRNFNDSWGADRFKRNEAGWPDDSEIHRFSEANIDGDGYPVRSGETRYVLVRGHWMRCKVYGGINQMWHCVCNGVYLANVGAKGNLFTVFPNYACENIWRVDRLKRALKEAVQAEDFLKAHAIKTALTRNTVAVFETAYLVGAS
jgi:hypothetical protein